ncbi:MAG: OmpA family protein, partial [Candidatus Poribacteria bacterium]|nr:OmpA family protein [Candidatus Poribacteria bacterium]
MPGQETEEHWVSISDVMAGLMVIFLFIAISYMVNANNKTDRIRAMRDNIEQLLHAYTNLQADLSEELQTEFEGTPTKKQQFQMKWQGHLDMATLSIRFKKPFMQGDATVPNAFKNVLRDFFPRYIAILTKPEYKDGIAEIRIEGHTSSEWFDQITGNEAYLNNMELSQNRARNVLDYILRIAHSKVVLNKAWLRKNLTANGLSSSQLILNLNTVRSHPTNSYSTVEQETGILKCYRLFRPKFSKVKTSF